MRSTFILLLSFRFGIIRMALSRRERQRYALSDRMPSRGRTAGELL